MTVVQKEIIDTIEAYDTIIIHRHVRPDPDAIGSQCSLKRLIKSSFPEKNVYAVGEEENSLTFLARMDVLEDDAYEGALVIACDTANTDRICDQRYDQGEKLVKIDHHPNNDAYGDLSWVDTQSSSTSEMIFELYSNFQDRLKMDETAARLIYAGIVGDTGRFLFPNTTNKTFQYASSLIEYPFDRQELYNNLYATSQHLAKLQGYILEHHTLSESGLSTIELTKEVLEAHHVKPNETGKLTGILGNVEGIKVWVLFIEEDDLIRVRLRSKGIVINTIAEKYNGGGHPLAAGASVYSWDESAQLIQDLEQLLKTHKSK